MIGGSPRILIIRLSAVGDVVRALPALHALREAYPGAQIDWAVERKSADVVRGHPALDKVWVIERGAGLFKAVRSFASLCMGVRRTRYDVVLDYHGILKSGVIAGFSRARDRYGFARPRSREGSYLFTNHRVKLPSERLTRVDENLVLTDEVAQRPDGLHATIFVSQDVQDRIDKFFDETFDGCKRVVAMHVAVDRAEKRWPVEHFAALGDMLLDDGRFEVMVTWGPNQLAVVEDVLAKMRQEPVLAPETPDLKHYTWLVHRADLYFGCDTGPMHIASVMGTPVVAVFGGTDPLKHAPFRQPYELLHAGEARGGRGSNAGVSGQELLRRVTPEVAYEACVRIAFEEKVSGQE